MTRAEAIERIQTALAKERNYAAPNEAQKKLATDVAIALDALGLLHMLDPDYPNSAPPSAPS